MDAAHSLPYSAGGSSIEARDAGCSSMVLSFRSEAAAAWKSNLAQNADLAANCDLRVLQ